METTDKDTKIFKTKEDAYYYWWTFCDECDKLIKRFRKWNNYKESIERWNRLKTYTVMVEPEGDGYMLLLYDGLTKYTFWNNNNMVRAECSEKENQRYMDAIIAQGRMRDKRYYERLRKKND